jgi:DNA-binding NarL/FixJ family response regulator
MSSLRIVLADDHIVVRQGLRALLNEQVDIEVVGEASTGNEAIAQTCTLNPDIVVLDLSMPELNGIAATARIVAECPQTKVLALTVHEDTSYLRQLLAAGAAGYVLKRSAGAVLIQALRAIAAGETYIDPLLVGRAINKLVHSSNEEEFQPFAKLSEREHNVLKLLAQGYAIKEIAQQLNLSAKTIETYKTRGSEKLNLSSRAALVRYALRQGWLDTDDQA